MNQAQKLAIVAGVITTATVVNVVRTRRALKRIEKDFEETQRTWDGVMQRIAGDLPVFDITTLPKI